MEIISCKRCSAIFTKISREICKNCMDIERQQFDKITNYLKNNKETDIDQLIAATGASKDIVNYYINSGKAKLELGKNPISYSCNMCGDKIQKGTLCKSCDRSVATEMSDLKENIKNQGRQKFKGHRKDNVLTDKKDDDNKFF